MRSFEKNKKKPLDKHAAASLIQQHFHAFFARKYLFTHLPKSKRSADLTFVLGNDPEIKNLEVHKPTEPVSTAILATSGLRVLKVACQLGYKTHPPKIFLVDNSDKVYQFWLSIKELAAHHQKAKKFLEDLPMLLDDLKKEGLAGTDSTVESETMFFEILIERFGFDYVRGLIMNMTCVCQTWEETAVFEKIKNHIEKEKIAHVYVYASNIVACIKDELVQLKILDNVRSLEPTLSIHTDVGPNDYPESVLISQDSTPSTIMGWVTSKSIASVEEEGGTDDSDEEFFASLKKKMEGESYRWFTPQTISTTFDASNDDTFSNAKKRELSSSQSGQSKKTKQT